MRRLSLLFFTAICAPALAQQAIPDTVITSARIPTTTERVPVATTTITREDIETRGYTTLADALMFVPGINVVPQGGPGALTSGFMRGLNSNHTQVLLDGVPVNDVSGTNNAFNFGSLLLAGVERIEVLRGPASSLYGSNALGGVVNIITRRAPADRQAQFFGGILGGSQATLRADGGVAGTVGDFDYLVAAESLSTRGFNVVPGRLATNRGEADGYRGIATIARLGWTPLPGSRVEGTLRWQDARFGLDRFGADDPNFRAAERRITGQIRGETSLFDGAWITGLRFGVSDERRDYRNLPDAFSTARANDNFSGQRMTLDWGNRVRLPELGPLRDGAASFGLGWLRESTISASGNAPFRTVTNARQDTISGHLALQYRLGARLDLSAGMRVDSIEGFGATPTWRLGAVYALPEFNTRLRAAVGSGFAAPSLFQRFGVSPFFVGNPNLRPERSTSWEVGVEHDVGRVATLGATYFQTWANELIDTRFAGGVFTPINVARARINGVETSVTVRPAPWLETRAAWTFTRAFNSDTGARLLRRPENVVSISARVSPIQGLSITPEILVTGAAQDFLVANSGASAFTPARKPGGTTANLAITYRASENITLVLQARNLGNNPFEPTSGYVIPGRSIVFGTRFSL